MALGDSSKDLLHMMRRNITMTEQSMLAAVICGYSLLFFLLEHKSQPLFAMLNLEDRSAPLQQIVVLNASISCRERQLQAERRKQPRDDTGMARANSVAIT